MRAMVLQEAQKPLQPAERPLPTMGPEDCLLRVEACGVCRTDLHILDGELTPSQLPLIPGHQIVGRVESVGSRVRDLTVGARVGVPWLGWTCGQCEACRSGRENLCARARFTGFHRDGGFAEVAAADARYCFALPDGPPAEQLAPLLCAGLIGYRALRFTQEGQRLGLFGFGASAHLVAQVARRQGRRVFAFVRRGDHAAESFARSLGAEWAGPSDQPGPEPLDAAIIFAPVGALVPVALRAVGPGGVVVCAGIHMSDIPSFPYELLWKERRLQSVANLTRQDGQELFELLRRAPLEVDTEVFTLDQAQAALERLRSGAVLGQAVLKVR